MFNLFIIRMSACQDGNDVRNVTPRTEMKCDKKFFLYNTVAEELK